MIPSASYASQIWKVLVTFLLTAFKNIVYSVWSNLETKVIKSFGGYRMYVKMNFICLSTKVKSFGQNSEILDLHFCANM